MAKIPELEAFGKILVGVGLGIVVLGILFWFGAFRWLPLGRLPGDIAYDRGPVKLYIPIVSMLVLSAFVSIVLWIIGALRK